MYLAFSLEPMFSFASYLMLSFTVSVFLYSLPDSCIAFFNNCISNFWFRLLLKFNLSDLFIIMNKCFSFSIGDFGDFENLKEFGSIDDFDETDK